MTDYREILRLHIGGSSQRNIAVSCACSRNTVAKVLKRALELEVSWPLEGPKSTNADLQKLFFPEVITPSSRTARTSTGNSPRAESP